MAKETSGGREWLVWSAAAVLAAVLLPLAMAVAAPSLASTPSTSLLRPPGLPVPERGALPSLAGLYQTLPVVVRGPADVASLATVADYDRARLANPASAAQMFSDAWRSLTVSVQGSAALQAMEGQLVTGQAGQQAVGASNSAFGQVAAEVMPDLGQDPANAARLNNAAAALYFLAWANLSALPVQSVDGFRTPTDGTGEFVLPAAATDLLFETYKTFPTSRAVAINLAYLDESLANSLLPAVLRRNPLDVTARLLFSGFLARGDLATPRPNEALAVLKPLVVTARTAAIGYAAEGDVYLTNAFLQRSRTPFTARLAARHALDAYDHALLLTTDPGAYTGRATALDFLDSVGQAVASEKVAASSAPGAIGPWILLSYLQEEAGDLAGMQSSAEHALALTVSSWSPPFSALTYHLFPWTARAGTGGYLHFSFATDGDVFAIPPQGGGFLEVLNLIPRTDQMELSTFRDSSTGTAALEAKLAADIATGDPAQAHRDVSTWRAAATVTARTDASFELPGLVDAARIVAGESAAKVTEALPVAQAILRDVGRFTQALALCRRLSGNPKVSGIAEQCAGESQYFLGLADNAPADRLRNYVRALRSLARGYHIALGGTSGDPQVLRLDTAFAATTAAEEEQKQGHLAAAAADLALARKLFRAESRESGASGEDIVARGKLADLLYEKGDLKGAIAAYTTTLAAEKRDYPLGPADDAAFVAEQAAYNNRGISSLTLAQDDPQAKPNCGLHFDLCVAAAGDFRQALVLDPANPVTLLNAGWVARLLGHEEDARRLLQSATLIDPSLYPAFNDLGVLSAEAGNLTVARHDFEAALSANPKYDLAAWNLGVLDTRQGLGTTLQGQAFLGRAIGENRALRSSELDYKTDERVYRYLVGADTPHGQALDRGYSVAATALGWIALLAALYQVGRHLLTDIAQERLAKLWDEKIPQVRARLVRMVRTWLRRPAPHHREEDQEAARRARLNPWLLALPALVLITLFLARRSSPDAVLPVATLTLLASAIALVTHEAGHRVVARQVRARVTAQHWGSSIPLALVAALIPAETNMGPFLGHRVEGEESEKYHHWVYLAGPAANLGMAAVAYLLFLAEPLPFFRLLAAVQLAVCAYALLPVKPLDGAELEEKPQLMLPFSVVLAGASLALALGLL